MKRCTAAVVSIICVTSFHVSARAQSQEPRVFKIAVAEKAAHEPRGESPSLPAVRMVDFSPDGKLLACAVGNKDRPGGVLIWDIREQRVVKQLEKHGISTVAFSPQGTLVACTKYSQPPVIYDIATGATVATLPDSYRGPVAFLPDGSMLLCADEEGRAHFWDIAAGADKRVLPAASDRLRGRLVFSPDGSTLLTQCGNAGIQVWDWQAGKMRHVLRHGEWFTSVAEFSSDGQWIITGGYDGTVRIWNAESGQPRIQLDTHSGGVESLDLAPRSELLAIAGYAGMQLYQLSLGEPSPDTLVQIQELIRQLEDDDIAVRQQAQKDLAGLGLTAEAPLRRAAEESPLAEIKIRARLARKTILEQPLATLAGHESRVSSVAFSPNEKLLASSGDDGTVRFWDVGKCKEVARIVIVDQELP